MVGPVRAPFTCRLLRHSWRSYPVSLVFGCIQLSVYSSSSDSGGYGMQSVAGKLEEEILENLAQLRCFFPGILGGIVSFLKEDAH